MRCVHVFLLLCSAAFLFLYMCCLFVLVCACARKARQVFAATRGKRSPQSAVEVGAASAKPVAALLPWRGDASVPGSDGPHHGHPPDLGTLNGVNRHRSVKPRERQTAIISCENALFLAKPCPGCKAGPKVSGDSVRRGRALAVDQGGGRRQGGRSRISVKQSNLSS